MAAWRLEEDALDRRIIHERCDMRKATRNALKFLRETDHLAQLLLSIGCANTGEPTKTLQENYPQAMARREEVLALLLS